MEELAPVDVGKGSLRMWGEQTVFEQGDWVQVPNGQWRTGGGKGQDKSPRSKVAEAKQEWLEEELAK